MGSTRTMAFRPPSVIQGAPSGPTITPCGRDFSPSLMRWIWPVAGSNRPRSPERCATYQTPPSGAGATSCGCDPAGAAGLEQKRLSLAGPVRGLRQRWTSSDEPLAVPLDLRREPVSPRHRTDEAEHRRRLHRPLLPGLAVDDFDGIEVAVAVHSLYRRVAEQFDVGCLLNPLGEVAGHMLVEVVAANDK